MARLAATGRLMRVGLGYLGGVERCRTGRRRAAWVGRAVRAVRVGARAVTLAQKRAISYCLVTS